jgi:hypothetical protein
MFHFTLGCTTDHEHVSFNSRIYNGSCTCFISFSDVQRIMNMFHFTLGCITDHGIYFLYVLYKFIVISVIIKHNFSSLYLRLHNLY